MASEIYWVATAGGFLTGASRAHARQQTDPVKADPRYAKPFTDWLEADKAGRHSGFKFWAIVRANAVPQQ